MAAIDRDQLLTDVKEELPATNTASDSLILRRAEVVISNVGDDDEFYNEVLCKTIKAVAEWNLAQETQMTNTKRKKTYEEETEWFDGKSPADQWREYIDFLPKLCASFGYCGLAGASLSTMIINVPDPVNVPCGSVPYGRIGFNGCDDDC